ncbi:MAG: helix-turn-helix transcriptional regulator [Tidjanibacter sp.]|nr:helix-turn-helix transcriptional regulator [Tidjanibacter sp.]
MKDQLSAIMQREGLTANKLSLMLGIQPSSISHIIAGRNKPGYDMIVRLIETFPAYNPEWLLTGKGSMLKESRHEQNPIDVPKHYVQLGDDIPRIDTQEAINITDDELFGTAFDDKDPHESTISHSASQNAPAAGNPNEKSAEVIEPVESNEVDAIREMNEELPFEASELPKQHDRSALESQPDNHSNAATSASAGLNSNVSAPTNAASSAPSNTQNNRPISRLIAIYDDNSFDELLPRK